MKLLYCDRCGDVFNLTLKLKACGCGHVKGMYVSYKEAVVNGQGICLAIGNGSLARAVREVYTTAPNATPDPRSSEADLWHHRFSIMCWARHHDGPSNPHTTIKEDL